MRAARDACFAGELGDKTRRDFQLSECRAWAYQYKWAVEKWGEKAYETRQKKNCEYVCTRCEDPNFCPHPDRKEMNWNVLSQIGAVGIVAVALASLFPFDLTKGSRSVSLYLPIAAILLFIVYEIGVRSEIPDESIPIRVDLIVAKPVLAFVVSSGVFRCAWLAAKKFGKPSARRTAGRVPQLIAVAVLACVCVVWFRTNWK